ncbi:MAG: thermopsin [Candidatus Marsarchaeota archaeon]|nr:thermopsin [Candidatus Marsarchaeota archaeon]MCL5413298.1 thermopsin [Candidatus Marsarchaeota archaeon]
MKIAFFVACLLVIGIASAQQATQIYYSNVTVGYGGSIAAGLNTTSGVDLVVIRSQSLGRFENGVQVTQFYNSTVHSGVYLIGVPGGNYAVIFESDTRITAEAVAYRIGDGHLMNLNTSGALNIHLLNYSFENITLLSAQNFEDDPVALNISGSTFNIKSDSNLEFLNVSLNRGSYLLGLKSGSQQEVFVILDSQNALVDPLKTINTNASHPIGIASYGLYKNAGRLLPYQISAGEVIGTANISEIEATDYNYSTGIVSDHGASLQLNIELNADVYGASRVFWLQDVADFNTLNKTFYMVDNIWNNTVPYGTLSNSTLSGMGGVISCRSCKKKYFYAYSYPNRAIRYSLPVNIKLVIMDNQTTAGTAVSFGYQLLGNGNAAEGPLVFYDKVLVSGAVNSHMLVTPYYSTPGEGGAIGSYYDAELVFGGEDNGSVSNFSKMNAVMWIYYMDNGTLKPFPSAYIFGSSTAESAQDINIVPHAGGALAELGAPDLEEQILVSNSVVKVSKYLQNTSQNVSEAYNYTTIPYGNASRMPPDYENYALYALVAVAAAAVLYEFLRLFRG